MAAVLNSLWSSVLSMQAMQSAILNDLKNGAEALRLQSSRVAKQFIVVKDNPGAFYKAASIGVTAIKLQALLFGANSLFKLAEGLEVLTDVVDFVELPKSIVYIASGQFINELKDTANLTNFVGNAAGVVSSIAGSLVWLESVHVINLAKFNITVLASTALLKVAYGAASICFIAGSVNVALKFYKGPTDAQHRKELIIEGIWHAAEAAFFAMKCTAAVTNPIILCSVALVGKSAGLVYFVYTIKASAQGRI